jgi:hypothetical protein
MKYRNSCAPRGSEESARPSTSRTRNDNLALERRADKYTPWEKATRGQGCLSHMANGSEPAARQGGDEPRSIHQPTTNIQPTTTNQPPTNQNATQTQMITPQIQHSAKARAAGKAHLFGRRAPKQQPLRTACETKSRSATAQRAHKTTTTYQKNHSVCAHVHTLTRTRKHSHASTHTRVSRKI